MVRGAEDVQYFVVLFFKGVFHAFPASPLGLVGVIFHSFDITVTGNADHDRIIVNQIFLYDFLIISRKNNLGFSFVTVFFLDFEQFFLDLFMKRVFCGNDRFKRSDILFEFLDLIFYFFRFQGIQST